MEDTVKQILAVAIVFAVVVGAILLIHKMFGSLSRDKRKKKQPAWTERVQREKRTETRTESSNRERIRKAYRKFMLLLQEKGAELRPNYTTADVHIQAATYANLETAAELRDLYRLARYDEGAEISSEQAKKAKELLRKID